MERRHYRSQLAPLHLVSLLCCICSLAWGEPPLTDEDAPLHNLLISVKNNSSGNELDQQQGFSGGIKRDKVFIGTGEPVRGPREGVTIRHEGLAYNTVNTQRTFSSLSEQKIRAVEGYPAFLYTGQSIKVPAEDSSGNTLLLEADALRGFYVTARLAGDRVILTISLSNDRLAEAQGKHSRESGALQIDTAHLSTTVSGHLGEWIDLGGITLGDTGSTDRQVKKTATRSGSIGNIAVKITALD
jgi:hypothetical protein